MSEQRDDPSRYLRTELLERIAHELRGPAGVTLGALDELEHTLGSDVVEQNRVLFAMARRGAKRVLRTAERLMRTALLESASPHITPVLGDVRAIVEQSVQDAEVIEGRSSVRVKLSMPSEPCTCQIDGSWLSVALSELVSQAIRCARREVEVRVQGQAAAIEIQVEDDRAAVAELSPVRFVKVEDRRDSALGWPLVHDVVRAHRGELRAEALREGSLLTGYRVTIELRSTR